jgi:inward rectifier potassium channel
MEPRFVNVPPRQRYTPPSVPQARLRGRRLAIIRGQDKGRWTDFYHFALTMPWVGYFAGMAGLFVVLNLVFATLYMADPHAFGTARPNFWDEFLFSVQTIGSLNISAALPRSTYANTLVVVEAFLGFVYLGLMTSVMFARFSRPRARVMFSRVAIIQPYEGMPTLMFRAANQRGNQILDAAVTVTFAWQAISVEGISMRRFEELKLVRSRTSLFALSWTVMHRIDESSPLYGLTHQKMIDNQMELVVLLSGTDDTLADVIYARHAYSPDHILWNRNFVDIIGQTPAGHRVVDLHRFHDTVAMEECVSTSGP